MPKLKTGTQPKVNCRSKVVTQPLKVVSGTCHLYRQNWLQSYRPPGQRMGEFALRQLIRDLCGWQALRGEELATLLGKDLEYLRNKHLSAMIQAGELVFEFPESPNHKLQAYKRPKRQ